MSDTPLVDAYLIRTKKILAAAGVNVPVYSVDMEFAGFLERRTNENESYAPNGMGKGDDE